MTALRNINLEIFCGKQIIRGRRNLSYDFYRILPLLCIGTENRKWMIPYFAMVDPGDTTEIQDLDVKDFQQKPPVFPESNGERAACCAGFVCKICGVYSEICPVRGKRP